MTSKFKYVILTSFVVFCALLLMIVIFMNSKIDAETEAVLESSIKSQLLSTANAARLMINNADFESYESLEDIQNNPKYDETLAQLRTLLAKVGAKYIYALKEIDGEYRFIFDTDIEENATFETYELSEVHMDAFKGLQSAGVMNMQDEYGSFNSGAVPIMKGRSILGIIAVDTSDELIRQQKQASRNNSILMLGLLLATLLAMGIVLWIMLTNIRRMQEKLNHMAYYDKLTKLPNRQFLLEHLSNITSNEKQMPFAIFFIDLDNFKLVNDSAGHDVGDMLLKNVAEFFANTCKNATTFRPAAGDLNMAARLGGDEFVIISPHIDNVKDALDFGNNMLENFKKTAVDESVADYNVSLSIGAALYTQHSADVNELLKFADMAMYTAKNEGKSCCRVYNSNMKPE